MKTRSLARSLVGLKATTLSRFVLAAVSLVAASLMSVSAQAQTDPAGWVGGLFGITVPNAENSTARPLYGITGGAKLGSEWGIGAYYQNSQKDEDLAGGAKMKFNFEFYGVEFAYHFEGEARGVYVGGRVGTSKISASAAGATVSTSPTHFGAVGGYNHFLSDHFSLGGDLSVLSVGESGGVKAFTTLNFLASAKLWF